RVADAITKSFAPSSFDYALSDRGATQLASGHQRRTSQGGPAEPSAETGRDNVVNPCAPMPSSSLASFLANAVKPAPGSRRRGARPPPGPSYLPQRHDRP